MAQPEQAVSVSRLELRDYFAGQALAGLVTAHGYISEPILDAKYAKAAYALADAMLAVGLPSPWTQKDGA